MNPDRTVNNPPLNIRDARPPGGWRGDCETIEQLSTFIRTMSTEIDRESLVGETPSPRLHAHKQGKCFSGINGAQPIYALVSHDDLQWLVGRLLTHCDAAFTNPMQREAFKDLIRHAIWEDWVRRLDGDPPY
jgi:hypothetical protein